MSEYRVEVHGSVGGNLVVGDHNLIVNATGGSSVTVLQEGQRPKPVRRPGVRVLPRRPAAVLGRSRELASITAAVVAQSTIQVYGPPGIGKSTLLRQAAYEVADEADGVVFLSAAGRGAADVPQDVFEAVYDTSGYRPGPVELRRLMAGVRTCVVADDLVASEDELGAIFDAVPDASFVFAAPERESNSGAAIELAGLSEEAALALVRHEFGRDLTPGETAAVRAEWRTAGGSPLRLLRAAAALSHPANPDVPAAVPMPAPRPASEQPTVPMSGDATERLIGALPAAERDVLALLGYVAPAAATVPAIAAMARTHQLEHVADAVERLARIGLLERVDGAYRLADGLVVPAGARTYRRSPAAVAASLAEWLGRPDVRPSDAAGHAELTVELIEAAIRAGDPGAGAQLARRAAPLAALSLRFAAWRDVLTSGQAAAKEAGDQEAYAYFTHERGIRLLCLGQLAAAATVLGTAVGLWQALGVSHGVAAATAAQAIAAGGAGVLPGGAAPSGPTSGPNGGRTARRAVGRARVDGAPSGFPTAMVITTAVVVVVLAVLAFILVPKLTTHHGAALPPVPSPSPSAAPSGSPGTVLPPPAPTAFSDNTGEGFQPAAVLDNDPRTSWASVVRPSPATDDTWIGIDMGVTGNRTGLSVTPEPRFVAFPSQFRIEYSADGVNWQTVPGHEYAADNPYAPTADGPQVFTFAQPVQARYIRFFATLLTPPASPAGAVAARSAAYRMAIADMQVLG